MSEWNLVPKVVLSKSVICQSQKGTHWISAQTGQSKNYFQWKAKQAGCVRWNKILADQDLVGLTGSQVA